MRCTRLATALVATASAASLFWPSVGSPQELAHVPVLRVDPSTYVPHAWNARAEAAKAFYATHRDAYDFLILFPAFPMDLSQQSTGEVLGTHWPVRNDVSGIGIGRFDIGSQFGSASRLKAVIDVHSLVPGVEHGGFDAAVATVAHEVAHQWTSRVAFRDPRTGQASRALLGLDGSHWSYFLDADASVMYGSDWRDAGGGRFVADASRKRYSPLDLYLMGFLAEREVAPFSLLEPAPGESQVAEALPPPDGTQVVATAIPVTVEDVIAAEGSRAPSADASQKTFRVAFAIVAAPGQEPTADQPAFVDSVRREWANRFFFMSRGRGLMEADLVEVIPRPVASAPSPRLGVQYLLWRQAADGSWADDPGTTTRDTAAAVRALSLHAGDAEAQAAEARGAAWLGAATPEDNDSRARRVGALAFAVGSPLNSGLAAPNEDGGHGLAAGYRSTVIDSALTALAERAAGRLDARTELIEFLLAAQRGDGGWPHLLGGASSVEPTAWVLRALAGAPVDTRLSAARDAAIAFLHASRRLDGSFGDDLFSGPSFTAEAVLALDAWGALGPDEAAAAADSLLGLQLADGSWGSSVHETAEVLEALRALIGPNLAVGPVSIGRAAVFEGEVVTLTAIVRNDGRGTATGVRVRAFDSTGSPFGDGILISELPGGDSRALQLTLETGGRAGNEMVFVVVDPDGVNDETREDDNRAAVQLRIAPAPSLPDPYIVPGTLAAMPASLDSLPTRVHLEGTVGNSGSVDAPALVTVYVRDAVALVSELTLAPRSARLLALDVPIEGGPGPVVVRVVARGTGPVPEASEQNNEASLALPLVPSVDLKVSDLAVAPATPEQGSEATFSWTLRNGGTLAATGVNDRVRVTGADGSVAAIIEANGLFIPAGGAVERRATWRPGVAGALTVQVDATHPAERNPTDNAATASVVVSPSQRPNLYARQEEVNVTPDPALEGRSFDVRAVVRNGSGVPAGPFEVAFFDGDPAAGRLVAIVPVNGLASGGAADIQAKYQASSDQEISAVVQIDAGGVVDEYDEGDNALVRNVHVLSLPDLALDSASIRLSNPLPRLGENVDAIVEVTNVGGQPSEPAEVVLHDGDPDAGGPLIGRAQVPALAAGTSASAIVAWQAAPLGSHELVALVVAATPLDASSDNNRAFRAVVVQDADFALSNRYLSPNGDGVQDETEVFYRLAEPHPVTLEIRDIDGTVVRRVATPQPLAAGAVAWDGRNDSGAVVRDGVYALTLTSDAGIPRVVGTMAAVVDNNLSPLHEAVGTPLIDVVNLDAYLSPYIGGTRDDTFAPMPDDSGAVQFDCNRVGVEWDCAFYFVSISGGRPRRLTPPGHQWSGTIWAVAPSPDGTVLAYYEDGQESRLKLFSIVDGSTRTVASAPQLHVWERPRFSPEGHRLLYFVDQWPNPQLRIVDVNGTEDRLVVAGLVREWEFSPDGRTVSYIEWDGSLRSVPVEGGEGSVLLPPGTFDLWLEAHSTRRYSWGPDETIFYIGRTHELWRMDVTSGDRTLMAAPAGKYRFPEVAASPLGDAAAFLHRSESTQWREQIRVASVPGAAPAVLAEAVQGYFYLLGWSPKGTFVHTWAAYQGGVGHFAFTSLANLTARVTAIREPGKSYVTFRGTAADLNFDGFEIRVRRDAPGEEERVVARGAAPVVSDVLGEWTPATDGVYEAVLAARDLAGNAREHRIRFGWSRASVISNVRRDPEYVSPDGDGVQDAVTLHYVVSAPTTVAARIETGSGQQIRTLQATHLSPGEYTLAWDGRDDLGWIVNDGEYVLRVEDRRFRVVVDTADPIADLELASDLPAQPGTEFGKLEVIGVPRNLQGVLSADAYQRAQDAFMNAALRAEDPNLETWRFEELEGPEAEGGMLLQQGADGIEQHVSVPMLRVGGRTYRLTVADKAGNRTRVERAPPERIYAIGLGLSDEVFNLAGYLDLALSMGAPPYRGAPALFAAADPISIPAEGEEAVLLPNGMRSLLGPRVCDRLAAAGRLTVFFSESIAEPIAALSLSYKRRDDVTWTEVGLERPQVVEEQAAIWDSGDLTGEVGLKMKLAAVDVTGRRFESPTFTPTCSGSTAVAETCASGDAITVAAGGPEVAAAERAWIEVRSLDVPGSALTFPIKEPGGAAPASTVRIPLSSLAGCSQEIWLRTQNRDSDFFVRAVNGCGAALGETDVSGTRVTTSVVESYPTPVQDVEIYARAIEGSSLSWQLVGRTGPFDRASPAVRLQTDAYGLCSKISYRLVTVLPDGRRIEEGEREDRPLCSQQQLQLECGRIAVSDPIAVRAAPRCVSRDPVYTSSVTGQGAVPFADVRATLLSTAGIPVREVPLSGFVAATTVLAASAEISGYALPDGAYLLGATATDTNGKAYEARSAASILVDSTRPLARIDAPSAGVLCPAGERRTLAVSGLASDANIEKYTVWIRPADAADDVATAIARQSAAGTLATLDLSSLPAGAYALGLEVRDLGGNAACTPEIRIDIPPAPGIENLSATPALIAPDGDGVLDALGLKFLPRGAATIELALRTGSQASAIATLAGDATSYTWSGSLADGSVPADGTYALEIAASGLCGGRTVVSTPVEIDTRAPVVRVDQPAPGSTVSAAGPVIGFVADAHLAGYRVSLGEGAQPAAFVPVSTGTVPPGTALAALPLGGMTPGTYTVLLEAWDAVGHWSSARATFTWAPGAILEGFEVTPVAVSPDGDGVRDGATATVRLATAALVALDLVSADGAVIPLVAGASGARGVQTFPLDSALVPLRDGAYQVRVTATAAAAQETALSPVVLDRAPPDVVVATPAAGSFVRGGAAVSGTVRDPLLDSWSLRASATGDQAIASGTEPAEGVLAVLPPLADGPHAVTLAAQDAAGNRREVSVPFNVDTTPPEPAITMPLAGTYVSGRSGPVLVTGSLVEANPATWRLEISSSAEPGAWRTLADGQGFPSAGVLLGWDALAEPDGPAVLRLTAVDRAGNEKETTVAIVVDNTPPSVAITSPRDGFLRDADPVVGSVSDENLVRYVVELADGGTASAYRFLELSEGVESVANGTLAALASAPGEGTYTLRVTAIDRAGNSASDLAGFTVDRTPPRPPPSVAAALRPRSDGVLTWEPSPDEDVVAYRVLRATGRAGVEPVGATEIATTWVDAALRDGEYRYVVLAIDAAGLVSAPSPEARLEVDTRPPLASISRPAGGARVRGMLEISGTAYSDRDFKEYRLSIGAGATPVVFAPIRRSAAPVVASALGVFDTTSHPEATVLTLRLEAEDLAGNVAEARTTFEVDNLAPPAPVLVSTALQGADVVVTWSPVDVPDLAGYLVWRNGVPASAPEGADVSDPLAFLVPAGSTTWRDRDVPDGTFGYRVQAVDVAGNASDLSNELGLSLDRRAPKASVVSPSELARLNGTVDVLAECLDQDVASVQIEARDAGAGGAFVRVGPARTAPPFTATLDMSGFGSVVEIRAEATDRAGRVDTAPGSIFVFHAPPLLSPDVDPRVDESKVEVAISDPNAAGNVAAYAVERLGKVLNGTSPRPKGTASASSTYWGSAAAGNDGDPYKCWAPSYAAGQWWQQVLDRPHLIRNVSLSRMTGTFDVLLRVRGVWVPVRRNLEGGAWVQNVALSSPLFADAMRVAFSTPSAGLCDSELTAEPVSALPVSESFSATGAELVADYRVSAIGVFGQRAEATESARVYAPVLDPTPIAVGAPAQTIAGGNATPGALVRISNGGVPAGEAAAGEDGRFAIPVLLLEGDNVLVAQATDALGNRSRPSAPVTIRFEQAPAVQIALVLDSVSGSEVSLSFAVSGDTSRVGFYELLRASGGPEVPVARAAATVRSFGDAGLRNGTYAYRVRPLSASGIPGAPSNSVEATVDVPVPTAPTLSIALLPSGGVLSLAWSFSGSARFTVERAVEAQDFAPIATGLTALTYEDAGLANGRVYRYRVTAVDPVGNASPPSNEVSGIPHDVVAPDGPVITEPTFAGAPLTVSRARITVAGVAEPGAHIELWQNGRYAGADLADTAVRPVPVATALPATSVIDVGPGGEPFAYAYVVGQESGIAIEWPSRNELATFPVEGRGLFGSPAISPDGTRVAFLALGYDGRRRISIVDVPSRTVTPALAGDPGGESELAWSPDGARLAYVFYRSSSGIGVLDVASGAERVFPAHWSSRQLAWIDDGSVGYVTSFTSLVALDATSGVTHEIARRDSLYAWTLARSTGALAIAGYAGGKGRVWLVQGPSVLEVLDGVANALAFSPDGSELAACSWGGLRTVTSPWAQARDLGEVDCDYVSWPTPHRFYVSGYGTLTRVHRGGDARFEVPVDLESGANTFVAFASDAGGNRSAPSEPISVTYDPAGTPDLVIEASIQPEVPLVGDAIQAMLKIRNLGAASGGGTATVVVARGDGTFLHPPPVAIPPLDTGASVTAFVPLLRADTPGELLLTATVDPVLGESDRDPSNNRVQVRFPVLESAGIAMSVTAQPQVVGADGSIAAEITVRNAGPSVDATLRVELADAGGAAVALPSLPLMLAASEARVVTATIPVGRTLAGAYRVNAALTSDAQVLAEASAPVSVAAEQLVRLAVVSERAQYRAAEDVTLLTTIRNASRNAPLADAMLRVEILDASSVPIVVQAARPIQIVWVGGEASMSTRIAAGTLPAGPLTAHAVVELNGAVVAEATTMFAVEAEPLLSGTLAVEGLAEPPVVKSGAVAVTTSRLWNVGTGAASGVRGHVLTFDARGVEVGRSSFVVGDLAPSSESAHQVLVPTGGLPLGTYGLALVAEYGGRMETLATARLRIADGRTPELAVLAPTDGAHVRGVVTPRVRATDDASGVATVRATIAGTTGMVLPFALAAGTALDGTWSGALSLGPDGPYDVVFSAADAEGNDGLASPSGANPVLLRVVSDTLPPQVRIDGVTAGALVKVEVTPVVVAEDLNLARVDALLDGASFGGAAVVADGEHTLVAVASDRAGNSSSASVRFSIDRTPPSIAVIGVDEGAFLAANVKPQVVVTDRNLESYATLLDGVPFQEGVTLTAERTYRLSVTARDRAGNGADLVRTFTIDKTAPALEISGVAGGAVVTGPLTPAVTASDANLLASEATLDGVPFSAGTVVAAEGIHLLSARALDRAGNATEARVSFVIDRTPPTIAIAGVEEGEVTPRDVTPLVIVEDANLAGWTSTVDGVEFPLGGVVITEGEHVLEVVATDLAGNVARATRRFEIDKTPPAIWASVQDGATYDDAVVVEFGATDRNPPEVTALLDGGATQSGVRVDADGPHELVVNARDRAGNEASATYRFEVLAVKYTVEKRLLERHARVLALLPCASEEAERIEAFLRSALPEAPIATVRTEVDLLVQLRSGLHDVVVIAGNGDPASRRCEPENTPPPLPPGELAHRAEQELTEAVFRGLGVVVFREEQAAWPQLVEALGLKYQGNEPAGAVVLRASAVSGAAMLSIPDGVELELGSAREIGTFERDGGSAAAIHAFGTGAAASFGFDPSLAETAPDAARLLAGAVAFVTPETVPTPRGVVAVGINVTNERRAATTRVRETLDPALDVVGVLAGGQRLATGEIEWRFEQASGETDRLAYLVRLPQTAGTYRTTTELALMAGTGERVYGTYVLDLTLTRGAAELAASAEALALALPAKGPDAADRTEILERLAAVAANRGTTAEDRERAITDLLAAIDAAKALRTLDPVPLRLALDEMLAAWESRP